MNLNEKYFLHIIVPENGATRFGFGSNYNNLVKLAQEGVNTVAGLGTDSFLSQGQSRQIATSINDALQSIGNVVTTNGLTVGFKAPITSFPNFNIINKYKNSGLLSQTIGKATDVVNAAGGQMTPNLAMQFQFPQLYDMTEPFRFNVSVILNKDIVSKNPWKPYFGTADNKQELSEIKPGAEGVHVFRAVMIAMILASPRRVFTGTNPQSTNNGIFTDIFNSITSTLTMGPPILDVIVGSMLIPTVHCESVKVNWGIDDKPPAYDMFGIPLEAELEFTFVMPLIQTQDDWNKFRIGIEDYYNTISNGSNSIQDITGLKDVPRFGATSVFDAKFQAAQEQHNAANIKGVE